MKKDFTKAKDEGFSCLKFKGINFDNTKEVVHKGNINYLIPLIEYNLEM